MTTTTTPKIEVRESLVHCLKCHGSQWWIRHGYPACFRCHPPEGGTDVEFKALLGTWPRSVFFVKSERG